MNDQGNNNQLSGRDYWESMNSAAIPRTIRLGYSQGFLWKRLLPRFLEKDPGKSVLEVGCAPGNNLVLFNRFFSYRPYGVEYSANGFRGTCELFARNGLDRSQVSHDDFFSPEFQKRNEGRFDVVFSSGFIEHFGNPAAAIKAHVRLLRRWGTLIVEVPNLQGINGLIARFLNPESFATHNLGIMDKDRLRQACIANGCTELFCGYHGVFSLRLFNAPAHSARRGIILLFAAVQKLLDPLFAAAFPKGLGHSAFAPYLIFIGTRRE